MTIATHDHGPAHIRIAGLSIWVFGRQFEELHDYWDGNWLRVLVRCEAEGSRVEVCDSIFTIPDLARWLTQLQACYTSLTGEAELACLEPDASAVVSLNDGRGKLIVDITPDILNQQHRLIFPIAQSDLPELMAGLEGVLARYPIRGTP